MTPALTKAQQRVLTAMQAGAKLLVSPRTALLKQEGEPDITVAYSTWRSLYQYDLIRRGSVEDETHRWYVLYGKGRLDKEPGN